MFSDDKKRKKCLDYEKMRKKKKEKKWKWEE